MLRSASVARRDFFGIKHLTNKDISGLSVKSKLPTGKISSKFSLLIIARNSRENKEVVHQEVFGKTRYDSDNITGSHGQYEPGNTKALFETTDIKQRYSTSENGMTEEKQNNEVKQEESLPEVKYGETFKISEVGPEKKLSEVLALFHTDRTHTVERYKNMPPLTFYFESPAIEQQHDSDSGSYPKLSGGQIDDLDTIINESTSLRRPKSTLSYDPAKDTIPIEDLESEETEQDSEDDFKFDKSIDAQYAPSKEKPNKPQNALDYLKRIRAGKTVPKVEKFRSQLQDENAYSLKPRISLDSHGFNNYLRQVPDWDACRHKDILSHLKRSIVYHNHDVLAVNKPYGLSSHSDSKRDKLDMNTLMQEIATEMRIEKVYLAHRLDKTTSGVLLFATSQKRADHLNKLFKSDQIKKTYWCITRGTPDPMEAIIDIPIGEYSVGGKVRSCLAPEKIEKERQMTKRYREARRAITEYATIQTLKGVSLVEVKPRTGVKHQIRCHLGFGINTPILGDHKYSHLGKLAPQELTISILNRLHLRQTKVRTLPMHLHAKTIVLPNVKPNGQNLFIEAPLPAHFKENLKTLGLLSKQVLDNL